MKSRILLIFASFLIPLAALAQHAKFYDYPIDGPISKFDKILTQQEGFVTSGTQNNNGSGTNFYDGQFIGLPCKLFVYYDPSSKNVYRVRVMIPTKTEQAALTWLYKVAEPLMNYYDLELEESTHGDYPSIEGFMMDIDRITPGRNNLFDNVFDVGWMEFFIGNVGAQYAVLLDIYDIANSVRYGKLPDKVDSYR